MSATARHARRRPSSPGALRVPQITAAFWLVKGLSTAMGESTSDYLVHAMAPALAVVLGFVAFVGALTLQLRTGRYVPWRYWLAVAMVGIFGTMAADVLHVGLGVPYTVSSIFYAAVLAAIFVVVAPGRGHAVDPQPSTPRGARLFYWATVVATFAMGTALGDFAAYTLHLGYFPSAAVFAAAILIPAVGYRWLRWNGILSFWLAYVVTRPLGASLADGVGKPTGASGLGVGNGTVALVLAGAIAIMVAFIDRSAAGRPGRSSHRRTPERVGS